MSDAIKRARDEYEQCIAHAIAIGPGLGLDLRVIAPGETRGCIILNIKLLLVNKWEEQVGRMQCPLNTHLRQKQVWLK